MYPQVELKIKNNIPVIIYKASAEEDKSMSLESESIIDAAMHAAKELNLIDSNTEHNQSNFEKLLSIAREADESLIIELPNIDTETIEFKLLNTLKPYLKTLIEGIKDEYSSIEMDSKIREELDRNKNSDIFASYMEGLYSILIAKTLLAASELGIGNIHLNDELKNPRLMEKMAKELEKLGLELIITE